MINRRGLLFLLVTPLFAQPVFRGTDIFPPEEFAARRAKVMAQIGDGVAILLGATDPMIGPYTRPLRQYYETCEGHEIAWETLPGVSHESILQVLEGLKANPKSKEGSLEIKGFVNAPKGLLTYLAVMIPTCASKLT